MRSLLTFFIFLPFITFGQVGVNTTTPNAVLDIQSTNNGVLIPRVQLTDALDIITVVNPAGGVLEKSTLVYNINPSGVVPDNVDSGFYFWAGSRWMPLNDTENWGLNGNTGTIEPTNPITYGISTIGATENYIGTTDNKDLVIGTNNLERIRIASFGNTSIGDDPYLNVRLHVKNSDPLFQIGAYIETTGTGNNIGVQSVSVNGNGFGTGGRFLGGEIGIRCNATSGNFTGTTYGVRGTASGTGGFGTRVGGYFDALSGINNYALITNRGQVGIGTQTPNLAQLQVENMIGNTTAMFRGNATSRGVSFAADWPGLYFNCYYNGGQKTMAPTGFPSIVNTDQNIGGLTFHTSNTANTASDALLATNIPERMRIDANGNVGIGIIPTAKLHVVNASAGALRIEDGTQAAGKVLTSDVNGVGTWQNPNTFAWSLIGNTVNAATNFIGSNNDVDVNFKRNGTNAGYLGQYNVAFGLGALQPSSGFYNVAIGVDAMSSLSASDQNVAVGWNALNNVTTGGNNIGIGTGAVVPSAIANNQIRLGNVNIGYAGVQVAWTITSDSRWKSNIQPTTLGLNFINNLNPVSYYRKNDDAKKTEYGFIAQEIDATLTKFGATNNGIITKDDAGMLGVRYNDLLSPMVKAIQELKAENDLLKKQNETLEARLKKIEEKLN